MIIKQLLVFAKLLDTEVGDNMARPVGAPGIEGLPLWFDIGNGRDIERQGIEDQHVGYIVAGIALHEEQFVERKTLYLSDFILMARIVEQFDVVAETPILCSPVLFVANSKVGCLWCAP